MQTSPAIRVFWFILLFAAFVVATWFSYDYGRSHPQPAGQGEAAPDPASAQRIAELEQERDALKKQVEELKHDVHGGRQALEAARMRISTLESPSGAQAPAPVTKEAAPAKPPETTQNTSAATTDRRLTLSGVRIDATESENRFRYSFSVDYPGNDDKTVVGTIWIAVNGLAHGQPRRLSLKEISAARRPFVKMSVSGRQDVQGEVTLPEGFIPRNLTIEAKPYDERYRGAEGKFDWVTGG
jgi:hypothetical protein